jgi:hypothetical protein
MSATLERLDRLRETCPGCQEHSAPPVRRPGAGFRWLRHSSWLGVVAVVLIVFELPNGVLGQDTGEPRPEPLKELYQDFRAGQRLHPSLRLIGPDADVVSRFEDQGLRITLPADRGKPHYPVEVVTTFPLSGDFEITGTYELLSAAQPTEGYGVGVSLNLADTEARNKFAKVARANLVKAGSVFQSEHWTNEPRRFYKVQVKPTESKLGRLRLVRKGASMRYLAADGTEGDFLEIWSQTNFGTEDLEHVHFVVADSGKPGNPIDARLIDLRIASPRLPVEQAPPTVPSSATPQTGGGRFWVVALVIGGLVVTLVLVGLGVRRSRGRDRTLPSQVDLADQAIACSCPGCGKSLRVKSELAGKKVRCPQCSQPVSVPGEVEDR